jgi:hypothetical protein
MLANLRYALKHALKANKKGASTFSLSLRLLNRILKKYEQHSDVRTNQHDQRSDGLSTPLEKLKFAKDFTNHSPSPPTV